MNNQTTGIESVADENSSASPEAFSDHSLAEDVRALLDDGKTYLEAELQFQKSRAAFAADKGRSGLVYGIAALALVHLALVALVVGLVFALSPLLTAWGATGLVVGVLSIAAVVLALAAKKRFGALSSAFGERK